MEEAHVLVGDIIEIAMVGHENNEKIVPHGQFLQAADKATYALIGISKSIEHLVVEAMIGHLEGFVTVDGLQIEQPLFAEFAIGNEPISPFGSDTVVHTPLAANNIFLGEIVAANKVIVAG